MSNIVESLRWLKQKLKEDAESKGFYQGSAGAETCQEAIDAFESLRQQLATTERLLAESQAREQALEDGLLALCYLKSIKESVGKTAEYIAEQPRAWDKARELLAMPSDSAALDAALKASYEQGRQQMQLSCDMDRDAAIATAKREVLLEASNRAVEEQWLGAACVDGLRRMADELKGGEQ